MTSRAATLPPHLSGTAVSAAADSELSAPERARVLSHLSRCAACRGRLVTEMATKDLVRSLGLGAPTPPSDLRRSLLSLGERTSPVRPARAPGRGLRPGAVGVLSAVGLTLGLAAAAAVPVATGTAQGPASGTAQQATGRTSGAVQQSGVQQSGVQQSGVQQSGVQQSGVQQSGVQQSGTRRSAVQPTAVVLPAAFTTGGPPVAPVLGAASDEDPADAPADMRAALLVVVEVVMARRETVNAR